MNIIVYSEVNNSIIAKADAIFGLSVVIIESCSGMTVLDLYTLINEKADVIHSYDMDDVVLKALGLYDRKREFGRMSEACMLYGIVTNFSLSGDGISIYPEKDECISMIAEDPRYSNIYVWRKKNDLNA